jgi:hypothetical protein
MVRVMRPAVLATAMSAIVLSGFAAPAQATASNTSGIAALALANVIPSARAADPGPVEHLLQA